MQPASDNDDTYDVREPAESVERPVRPVPAYPAKERLPPITEEPLPEPPRFPLLIGVFSFPWYLRTLAPWLLMSLGLTVSALGVIFWIWLVYIAGVYLTLSFALAVFLIATFSLSYSSACCLVVIETTSQGYDQVVHWPSGFWRDWFWTMLAAGWMLALSIAAGGAVGKLASFNPWLSALLGAYVLFPIFLLSSLEAGSVMVPLSWAVLRTFKSLWWAWGIFYLETAVLFAAWLVPTIAFFPYQPFVTLLVAGPFLAAVMLIYARLLGRLVWCFGEYGDEELDG